MMTTTADDVDPNRPLWRAVVLARVIGGLLGLFALLLSCVVGAQVGRASGWVLALAVAFYLVPAVLLLIFAAYMNARRRWAVIATLCLACLNGGYFAVFVVGRVVRGTEPLNACGMTLLLTMAALQVALAVCCVQALRWWHLHVDAVETRGFTPIIGGAATHAPSPPAGPPDGDAGARRGDV